MRRWSHLLVLVSAIVLGSGTSGMAQPGDITLASTSDAGVKGNSHSFSRSLSADGTSVALESNSDNLDPSDTDRIVDVYVKEDRKSVV